MSSRRYKTLAERFHAKHTPSATHSFQGTPCWEWTGCRHRQGYGQMRGERTAEGRGPVLKAHRISYELHTGPIPDDLPIVNHLCEHKFCVNPAHLEATDQSHNTFYSTPAERAKRAAEVDAWHAEHTEHTEDF